MLPSGLHASLLIRATARQQRNTDVTVQYRHKTRKSPSNQQQQQQRQYYDDHKNNDEEIVVSTFSISGKGRNIETRTSAAAAATTATTVTLEGERSVSSSPCVSNRPKSHHVRFMSEDTRLLPDASILNSTITNQALKQLVNFAMSGKDTNQQDYGIERIVEEEESITEGNNRSVSCHTRIMSEDSNFMLFPDASTLNSTTNNQELQQLVTRSISSASSATSASKQQLNITTTAELPPPPPLPPPSQRQKPPRRPLRKQESWKSPRSKKKHHRHSSSTKQVVEWMTENDVRDLYGASPADLPEEIALEALQEEASKSDSIFVRPLGLESPISSAMFRKRSSRTQDFFSSHLEEINDSIDEEHQQLYSSESAALLPINNSKHQNNQPYM